MLRRHCCSQDSFCDDFRSPAQVSIFLLFLVTSTESLHILRRRSLSTYCVVGVFSLRRRSLFTYCVVRVFSLRRRPRRFCSIRRLSCHDFNRFFHRDSSVPKQRTRDLNITDHSSANFVVFKSTKRVYFPMTRNLWLTTLWL